MNHLRTQPPYTGAAYDYTPPRGHAGNDRRSISDLIKDLRDEAVTLARQEVNLAKAEMSHKAGVIGRNLVYLGAGAVIVFLGVGALVWAASIGLTLAFVEAGMDTEVAAWLAPMLVGIIVVAMGGAFLAKGIHTLREESLTPDRTAESMRENTQWIKQKVQS